MKSSIDLTDNRDFKNNDYNKFNYRKRDLPWEKAAPDECAVINKGFKFTTKYQTIYNNLTSLEWLDSIRWISEVRNNDDLSSTSFHYDFRPHWFIENIDSGTSFSTTSLEDYGTGVWNYGSSIGGYVYSKMNEDIYDKSPCGYRDNVIEKIKRRDKKKSNYYKYSGTTVCRCCGKRVAKSPWNTHDGAGNYHSSIICKKCEKSNTRKETFNLPEDDSRLNRWHPGLRRTIFSNYVLKSIPCISSDIKPIRNEDYCNYNILNSYSHIDEERVFYNKRKRHEFYIENRVTHKDYKLSGRRQPWQPKGRKPQEYDTLFSDINWKDLLEKRIQLLTNNFQ